MSDISALPYTQSVAIVQGKQKQVQEALQEASIALRTLQYDDSEMNQVVTTLQSSINKTLQAGWKGTAITKEYIETTYAEEIRQTKSLYSGLNSEKRQ